MAINVPIISQFDNKGVKSAMDEFKKLETPAQKAGFAIQKAFLPAAAALGALTVAAVNFGKAAADDQAAAARLAGQLRRTTSATDAQIKSTESLIGALELATNIADNDLRDALGRLVTVTKDVEEGQRLLALAVDISAATGKDLGTVSEALAKAYGGNLTALQRLEPSLRSVIKAGADFDEIGQTLAATFGGAAVEAAQTAEGRFQNLQVRIGNLQEVFGYMVLEIADKVLPILASLASFIENNTTVIAIAASVIGTFAAAIVAINIAMKAFQAIIKAKTAVMAIYNAVLAANPIVLITLAVVALIAIFVVLQQRFNIIGKAVEALGKIFEAVKEFVLKAWNAVLDWFKALPGNLLAAVKTVFEIITFPYRKAFELVLGLWNAVWDWFKALPGRLVEAVSTVFKVLVQPFLDVVNAMFQIGKDIVGKIVDGIKSVAGSIGSAILNAIPGGGLIGSAVGKIKGILPFAEGGLVTGPTVGLVGEAGPELVIPLDRLEKLNRAPAAPINITVTSADPQAVVDAIRRYNRTNGPAPIAVA